MDDLPKMAYDLARSYHSKYAGCAQCAAMAIQDALGIRDDGLVKAANALNGGLVWEGLCGGITGGALMIAYLFGRGRDECGDGHKALESDRLTVELHNRFVSEIGGSHCFEVQAKMLGGASYDLRTDEGWRKYNEAGGCPMTGGTKCTPAVATGARLAVEVILEEMARRGMALDDLRRR